MVTSIGTVNADSVGEEKARAAILAYDYTVLAGTLGTINRRKKDRLLHLAGGMAPAGRALRGG